MSEVRRYWADQVYEAVGFRQTVQVVLASDYDAIRARVAELEGAGDRLRAAASAAMDMTKEWHGGLCSCRKCKVRDELGLALAAYEAAKDPAP